MGGAEPRSPGGPFVVRLAAVILAVTEETPRVLVVRPPGWTRMLPPRLRDDPGSERPPDALPFGALDPDRDRTLELALRGWVRQQTGLELGYVEQLYTFGDRFRDPRERLGGPRTLSVAYLALVREGELAGGERARWRDAYAFLPWEDRREKAQPLGIGQALARWADGGEERVVRQARRERADIAFGLGGAQWDGYRVLDRYELLYEAGLVEESWRDRVWGGAAVASRPEPLGRAMAFDHRRILATALSRIRGKIKYRPVVFELLPETFTLLRLQRAVESLSGVRLHKQNFRRLVERAGLVEGTGAVDRSTGGRPAKIFRFRREVLKERPSQGVSLPGLPSR